MVSAVRRLWENTASRAGGLGRVFGRDSSYLEEGNPHEGPARANTQRREISWMWPEVQRAWRRAGSGRPYRKLREQEAEVDW